MASVTVPALEAWLELERGELLRAGELADQACASAATLGVQLHHGVLEAHTVAARCHLERGDLVGAERLAEQVGIEADELRFTWSAVRSGALRAELARLRSGPAAALRSIDDVRARLPPDGPEDLEPELAMVEVAALLDAERPDEARLLLAGCGSGPRATILTARVALTDGQVPRVSRLLADRSAWPLPLRIEAELLLAANADQPDGDATVTDLFREGAGSGWVGPFLRHRAVVEALASPRNVARLHPDLARAWWPMRHEAPRPVPSIAEPLTPRELTILRLLPTHLSNADIGEQLFISVNTVKAAVKSIYRKLGAGSRSDAVEVAREAQLLDG